MYLFVYCAGGFGREIYDTALRQNAVQKCWTKAYFIDDNASLGGGYYGTSVYSLADALTTFGAESMEVAIASGEPIIRQNLYDRVKANRLRMATVVDPSAIVSPTASLGEGVVVTAFCIVATQAVLEYNTALNVQAIIGHDIRIGAHSVVSSMVNVGGACTIGTRSYLGMGAQVIQGISVGDDVIVGMGSVVHSSIPDEMIAMGNPARPVRKNVDKRVFK